MTRAYNLRNFGGRVITINGIRLMIDCFANVVNVLWYFGTMVIFYKWYIQKWNMNPLLRKSIPRNERSQFIVENTSQWQSSRLSCKNSCMLTDSPDRQSLLFSAAAEDVLCLCASLALFDEYFLIIAITWRNRWIPINCNYFCWPSDYN